jgi:transcriptional regulator with XRE-family HTH domain
MIGWTQAEFARRVGVDRARACHWEAGRAMPSREHRETIADVLGVSQREIQWQPDPPPVEVVEGEPARPLRVPIAVRRLFEPPFRRMEETGYIYDRSLVAVVIDHGQGMGPEAAGYTRILGMPDAEEVLDAWSDWVESVRGDCMDLDTLADRMTEAWRAER